MEVHHPVGLSKRRRRQRCQRPCGKVSRISLVSLCTEITTLNSYSYSWIIWIHILSRYSHFDKLLFLCLLQIYIQIYAQDNTMGRKFRPSTPSYTAHLWFSYSKAKMKKPQVTYNEVFTFRILFKLECKSYSMFMTNNDSIFLCRGIV